MQPLSPRHLHIPPRSHHLEFGFDVHKLSKQEAARVASLLSSDLEKRAAPRFKQLERQRWLEELERKKKEELEKEMLANQKKERRFRLPVKAIEEGDEFEEGPRQVRR